MELETISESKHKELSSLLKPLLDFMVENKYSYFFVAGKDGVCSRHLRGNYDDVEGMIAGIMKKQKQVGAMLTDIVNDFNELKK